MVQVTAPTFPPTLVDLSRNASVISSSSETDILAELSKSPRPRPARTFSSPRSQSPQSRTATPSRPPNYLTRELGVSSHPQPEPVQAQQQTKERSKSRKGSREASRARSANGRLGAQDFSFGDTLGEGSYSTVMRAQYIRTGQEYAIKILDKNHLIRKDKMLVALAEKNVLVKLGAGHPGIIHLHWTFQDEWSLFFVLDLAPNGEMQSRISRLGSLSLTSSRYYAAQIIDALEYIHGKDVIHRDLKPENLLLDSQFRIKITDFGTGKILENGAEKANTFVGTAQYVAPELLESNETSKSSDLWALGCIIYQMISGRFAFQGLSEYLTWQKIKSLDYTFPDGFDEDAQDLIRRLFVREPTQRLGAGGPDSAHSYAALRAHPFFASVSWETLWTDPAPSLEAGLVKKDVSVADEVEGAQWDDVGEMWDRLVGGNADVSSGSGEGETQHAGGGYAEEGPMGEMPDYIVWQSRAREGRVMPGLEEDLEETETVLGEREHDTALPDMQTSPPLIPQAGAGPLSPSEASPVPTETIPPAISIHVPKVNGPGSGSSSSDGSPVEGVTADLTVKLRIGSDAAAKLKPSLSRGRNRAQTPVQGNGPCSNADWSSLLLPSERVLFHTRVEARSPKRRGSKLRLPISASLTKTKTRQLVLTSMRLLCVKQKDGGQMSLKSEVGLRAGDKGKEREKPREAKEKERDASKDCRNVIESAEPKGEREFVILTSNRSQTYAAETSTMSAMWVEKINEALVRGNAHLQTRTQT
ncbi:kinase-like domain-containing protein [Suillus subaureus]|uniref:non-specific serine/threonine protein kinase n=1 Tax=Suillus subaureus TaxID=48587 RepID=A0A9P7E6Y5_9AGAM|nr:kinase-like domain-containing protein [Suillus subaureus]KAG1812593.1 kinase-like domain-containing protein [Suillus subaureus]